MIEPDQVLVFYCPADRIRDRALLDRYRRMLSPSELKKLDRIRLPESRHLSLIARALVRYLLGRYTGLDPASVTFTANDKGKPALAPGTPASGPLYFNLSHCKGGVACALCTTHEVGVDLETLDRRVNIGVADRFFAGPEADRVRQAPPGREKEVFLDLWTLKEAYVKACGRGLSIPLDAFSFDLSGDVPLIAFRDGADPSWQFFRWRPEPGRLLAAAVQADGNIRFGAYHCIPLAEMTAAGPESA